jgi:hypothetical protein
MPDTSEATRTGFRSVRQPSETDQSIIGENTLRDREFQHITRLKRVMSRVFAVLIRAYRILRNMP